MSRLLSLSLSPARRPPRLCVTAVRLASIDHQIRGEPLLKLVLPSSPSNPDPSHLHPEWEVGTRKGFDEEKGETFRERNCVARQRRRKLVPDCYLGFYGQGFACSPGSQVLLSPARKHHEDAIRSSQQRPLSPCNCSPTHGLRERRRAGSTM